MKGKESNPRSSNFDSSLAKLFIIPVAFSSNYPVLTSTEDSYYAATINRVLFHGKFRNFARSMKRVPRRKITEMRCCQKGCAFPIATPFGHAETATAAHGCVAVYTDVELLFLLYHCQWERTATNLEYRFRTVEGRQYGRLPARTGNDCSTPANPIPRSSLSRAHRATIKAPKRFAFSRQ